MGKMDLEPRAILTAFMLLCAGLMQAHAEDYPFWGQLVPGVHAVGFRAIFAEDGTRHYWPPGEAYPASRPLRVFVWYPASKSPDPMRFGDYFKSRLSPDDPAQELEAALLVRDAFMARFWSGFSDAAIEQLRALRVAADEDAPAAGGAFPLILYSHSSGGSQQENLVLAEYLASHGYVVASIPQVHAHWPRIRPGSSSQLENQETQIRDLEFARHVLGELPFVDDDRLGLIGYSGGSVYALFLAMRADVGALISLDGTITFDNGKPYLDSPLFTPRYFSAPVLNLHKASEAPDKALMMKLSRAERFWMAFPNTTHIDFQQVPMLNAVDPSAVRSRRGKVLRTHDQARASYEAMARIVRAFMDAKLRARGDDWEILLASPTRLGISQQQVAGQSSERASGDTTSLEFAMHIMRKLSSGADGEVAMIERSDLPSGLEADELGRIGQDMMSHRSPPRDRAALVLLRAAMLLDSENVFRLYDLGDAHLSTAIDVDQGYEFWQTFVDKARAAGIEDWRVDTAANALQARVTAGDETR